MKFLARYIWSPFICGVAGVKVVGSGLENVEVDSSAIYVANHSSLFDIVAVCRVSPVSMFYISKKELKKVPLMGQFMWAVGMIFIDRKNKDKAMESMRMAASKINSGKNVISYPEGTRSKDGQVQLFKRGSFLIAKAGKIDIAPIAIKGANEILASGSSQLNAGVIKVHFMPRVRSESFKDKSEEQIASECRGIIVEKIKEL